jgi:hypothetical protein
MKPCLLCPWSFIIGFIDEITDEILNINIFKIFIDEVKLKFSVHMKILKFPSNIIDNFSLVSSLVKEYPIKSKKEH